MSWNRRAWSLDDSAVEPPQAASTTERTKIPSAPPITSLFMWGLPFHPRCWTPVPNVVDTVGCCRFEGRERKGCGTPDQPPMHRGASTVSVTCSSRGLIDAEAAHRIRQLVDRDRLLDRTHEPGGVEPPIAPLEGQRAHRHHGDAGRLHIVA